MDNYCCENEWDEICQLTYDYCEGTWTGPIPARLSSEEISVYPNPTSNIIYITKKVDLEVINYLGDIVISKNDINSLDLSRLSSGIYNLRIVFKDNTINTKIIKK